MLSIETEIFGVIKKNFWNRYCKVTNYHLKLGNVKLKKTQIHMSLGE
jgi:hypothetical protein